MTIFSFSVTCVEILSRQFEMTMSPTIDQAPTKITNQSEDGVLASTECALGDMAFSETMEFPEGIDDDFLMVEELGIVDDFDGLLDINPSFAFESSADANANESSTCNEPSCKRQHERPHSPPPKKIKAIYTENASPVSVMSIASAPTLSSIPNISHENEDLQYTYVNALRHLALSMRRSEMTRNEIIRQRKEAETLEKLQAAQHRTVSNAENFLVGNSATLTAGLDQSRRMLKALIAQATTQPF